MTMWPGYGDGPHHSPIRILQLIMFDNGEPNCIIDTAFCNAACASGVRDKVPFTPPSAGMVPEDGGTKR